MKSTAGLSIRSRLKAIIMITSASVLVLACAAFLVYDYWASQESAINRLSALSQLMEERISFAISADDKEQAEEFLVRLESASDIIGARLFTNEGKSFAQYVREGLTPASLESNLGPDGIRVREGMLESYQPVLWLGNREGTLYIVSDMSQEKGRLQTNAFILGGVLFTTVFIAYLLASRLERSVTGPILNLAGIVKTVTQDRNYALRAEKARQDEMGSLIDGVNDMLSQIQVRDQALQMAREELELRVEERTAELTYANDELERSRSELALGAKQQAAVAELGQRALAGGNVQAIMQDAAKMAVDTLRVEFSRILEILPDGGLQMRTGVGWKEDRSGQRLDSPETLLKAHGVVSSTSVQIQGEKEPYGILSAHTTKERTFSQEETNFLRALANVLATALHRARAERILRENEARYRLLVEHSPDAVLIHLDGRFVYANPAAVTLFGASEPAELLGTPILDRLDPEYSGAVKKRLINVLQGGKDAPMIEDKLMRLDGTPVDVELAAIPFTQQGQRAIQVVIRDITQRREVERMKGEFISVVSHELRTPLTSIQGSLGLIANGVTGELPAAAKPMVDIAYNNCQRLVRLINDILDVEKMAAGKMNYLFKPVEMMGLVQQSIEANRGFGTSHGVAFALKSELPGAKINGDADRIIQVLTNLMSNAAKFSPKGTTVDVAITRRENRVRVSIRDYGSGIPEEFRKRIFQKFSQADSSDVRKKGGTGLGLVICKAIIDKHGGEIWFESEAGKGTSFIFELPEHRDAPSPASEPADAGRVLVCEDDEDVAAWFAAVLGEEKYRVDVAGTVAEASKRLRDQDYRALILDLSLPDGSGLDLMRDLRQKERTRDLPIIVVSASASKAEKEINGTAAAVLDWIDKPADRARLAGSIKLAARRSRGSRARVLHVEDDSDTREVVAASLKEFADVEGAGTLEEAKGKLDEGGYDVVILDVMLPDGSGLDLIPSANRPGRNPTPILVYSSQELEAGKAMDLAGAMVKSQVDHEQLRESIKSLLLDGRAAETQGVK